MQETYFSQECFKKMLLSCIYFGDVMSICFFPRSLNEGNDQEEIYSCTMEAIPEILKYF